MSKPQYAQAHDGDVVVFEYGRLTNTVDRCNDGMISFSQWPLEKIDVIAPLHV